MQRRYRHMSNIAYGIFVLLKDFVLILKHWENLVGFFSISYFFLLKHLLVVFFYLCLKQRSGLGASNHASPSKKLSRSQSDTSGGTPVTSLLRKRNIRPAVDSSSNSPTRTLRLDVRNTSPPLPQNQYNRPTRALSSPSMFVNSFGGRTGEFGSVNFSYSYCSVQYG